MKQSDTDFLAQIGLSRRNGWGQKSLRPILLTGASTDPQTGLIASLASETTFANGRVADVKIKYFRQLPYGQSKNQTLIAIRMNPDAPKGEAEIDELWVQSQCVYDRKRGDDLKDPATRKRVANTLEGVNRLNGLLRQKGPVEQTAKILADCYFDEILGEEMIVRGLKKTGGFDFSLAPYFTNKAGVGAGEGAKKPLVLNDPDLNMLKTTLGFSINTMEPDKDFSDDRVTVATDPQSGITYKAGVRLKETKGAKGDVGRNTVTMDMYVLPHNLPEGLESAKIPELLKFKFTKTGDSQYTLDEAKFSGLNVEVSDTQTLLRLFGMAQASNRQLADWKYPAFMDQTAKYDLLDLMDPLHPPKSLEKDGGEFLYTSMNGCGFEKKIENFGDQIGAASLFMHRGTKADGSVSAVGLVVDFPFATGGPKSNYDGAIPDYLPFWDDIEAFCITHDHFDHCDGLPFYAKAGMMRNKTVYATDRVKYFLDKKMDALKVSRSDRPQIKIIKGEGAFPIKDRDGINRLWVQYSENATRHSALTTPFIVSGWYGNDRCKGSVVQYGDSNGLTKKAQNFFKSGLRLLPVQAAQHGEVIDPKVVDRDFTVVLHDPTGIRYHGVAPKNEEVEGNLSTVVNLFGDKGILLAPISTNDAEYTAGFNVAHATGRDITGVGRNAELRLSCKNLFGVLPDLDLRNVRIDAWEEFEKPEEERLIPSHLLELYFEGLADATRKAHEKGIDPNLNDEAFQRLARLAHEKNIAYMQEKLPPEDRDHEKSVSLYIYNSLQKYGAVVFENDINGYFMWKAVMDRKAEASIRATRMTKLAKGFRDDPSKLMIFLTGTQGNAEEKFSTLQKFANFFSLLDVNETISNTGYKINAEDYVAFITQPPIPGNEEGQDDMIRALIARRNMTVVGAFMNGFKIYNAKGRQSELTTAFRKLGWKHEMDAEGNIRVYNKPIHIHGHSFREDLAKIATQIPAKFHEVHHIPDYDAYSDFRKLMAERKLHHSSIKPDDFQVMSVNDDAPKFGDVYSKVAQLNPSFVLVRMARKYGHFFGGWLELVRSTMLRRDGNHRADGLMATTEGDGVYARVSAQRDWEMISNPAKRSPDHRIRRMGPSRIERHAENRGTRNRMMWSGPGNTGNDSDVPPEKPPVPDAA